MGWVILYEAEDGSVSRIRPLAAGSVGRLRRVMDKPAVRAIVRVPRVAKRMVPVQRFERVDGGVRAVMVEEELTVALTETHPLLGDDGKPVMRRRAADAQPEPVIVAVPLFDDEERIVTPETWRDETEDEFQARCIQEHVPVRLLDDVPPDNGLIGYRGSPAYPVWPKAGEFVGRVQAETLGLRFEEIPYLVLDEGELPPEADRARWRLKGGRVIVGDT